VETISLYNLYSATSFVVTFEFENKISVIDSEFYLLFISDNETSLSDEPYITLKLYDDTVLVHQQYTTSNLISKSLAYNSNAVNEKLLFLYPLLENGSGITKTSISRNSNKFTFDKAEITFYSHITTYSYGYTYSYVTHYVDVLEYYGNCTVNYFPIYNIDFIYGINDYNDKITLQNIDLRNRSGSFSILSSLSDLSYDTTTMSVQEILDYTNYEVI